MDRRHAPLARMGSYLRTVLGSIAALACTLPVSASAAPRDIPDPIARSHDATILGKHIAYTAAFERFSVASPDGTARAMVTTISYVKRGRGAERPVVFAFNGGPGSPSVFLNVGLLGPDRVELPADPAAPIPAHPRLVANGDSILDVADIVLIDPVGTGLGAAPDPAAAAYFYSVRGDAGSVSDTIAAWTQRHGREASPKYVLGESYGAVRAVLVASAMAKTKATANVDGVILLSQSLQIVDTVQRRSNIVGQVVGMPTLAAAAWYHGLAGRGRTLDAFARDAATFAREQWLPALLAGSRIDSAERDRVATGLAGFTGLPAAYFAGHDLYLTKDAYRDAAFAARGQRLGLYDDRYVGPRIAGRNPDDALIAAITVAGDDMWRRQLGIEPNGYDRPDASAIDAVGERWDYLDRPFAPTDGDTYQQFDYVADAVRLMADRPRLRLLVAGGWFDTAASAGADDYFLSRPGLDHARIAGVRYPAGHMFYTDPYSRAAFAARLRDFVATAPQELAVQERRPR